jgi:hypothetical protein
MEPTAPSPAQGAPSPYRPPPTSGLAVASLVCAVLGLLFLPLALAAIVLGIVALSKIKGSGGRLGGRGLAIAGVAVGTVGLLLVLAMAALLLPVLARAREQARRASSANNLANMVKCCHLYADATPNLGRFPDDPTVLYTGYVKDWRVFKNPRFPEEDVGYIYLPGSTPEDARNVIFYENVPEGRAKEGRNVAIAAGRVDWVTDQEFQAALSSTRQALEGKVTPIPISISKIMKKGP